MNTKTNPNELEGWLTSPLVDENIDTIVIPSKQISDLRKLSKKNVEYSGLLFGAKSDLALYMTGYLVYGIGSENEVEFEEKYRRFNNNLVYRLIDKIPGFTTMLYHNHPIPNFDDLPEREREIILENFDKREFKESCVNEKKEYTPEYVLSKLLEMLSPQDLEANIGAGQILLTDTAQSGDNLSHIHAHRIDAEFDFLYPDYFEVLPLSMATKKEQSWLGGICSTMKKIDLHLRKEFKDKNK